MFDFDIAKVENVQYDESFKKIAKDDTTKIR